MANSGIQRIDDLLTKPGEPSLKGADSVETTGAIQDLLRGHGASGLPNLASDKYGKAASGNVFDTKTLNAVHEFQKKHDLPVADAISAKMLSALVQTPASNPLATRAYLTMVLDKPWTPLMKVLSLVAIVAMKDESVRRLAKQFPPKPTETESIFTRGDRARREFYIKTPLLSSTAAPPPAPASPILGLVR